MAGKICGLWNSFPLEKRYNNICFHCLNSEKDTYLSMRYGALFKTGIKCWITMRNCECVLTRLEIERRGDSWLIGSEFTALQEHPKYIAQMSSRSSPRWHQERIRRETNSWNIVHFRKFCLKPFQLFQPIFLRILQIDRCIGVLREEASSSATSLLPQKWNISFGY